MEYKLATTVITERSYTIPEYHFHTSFGKYIFLIPTLDGSIVVRMREYINRETTTF